MVIFSILNLKNTNLKENKITKTSILRNPFLIIPVLVFTIVIGLRYNVGIDYIGYKKQYDFFLDSNTRDTIIYFEFAYLWIFKVLAFLNFHYVWPFLVTAFLQIYCIYFQSSRYLFLLPYVIFFYFVSTNFMYSLNIMRQTIALNMLLVGVRFILDKNIFKWIACCFLASLFHVTALTGLLFYFLNKNIIRNKYFSVVFIIVFFYASQYIFKNYLDYFLNNYLTIIMPEYSNDSLVLQDRGYSIKNGFSFFDFFTSIVYLVFINNYEKCSIMYKKYGFILFFNLSVIGTLIFPLVHNNILLDRINYYFMGFRFLTFAFYSHYFLKVNRIKFETFLIIGFMIMMFLQFLKLIEEGSNGISPFQFANLI